MADRAAWANSIAFDPPRLDLARATPSRSEVHFQYVKSTDMPIDGIDDLALVDKNVVELDGSGGCSARCGRHKGGYLVRAIWIRDIVSTQAAVEERAENDPVGVPGCWPRHVFMDIVGTEAAASTRIVVDALHGTGRNRHGIGLLPPIEDPDELRPVLGIVDDGLIGDDQELALE